MQLEKAMKEINDFIKVRMNILLGDLIVQSEEYEDTKRRILQLPFIQQIINEQLTNIQPPSHKHISLNENIVKETQTDIVEAVQQIIEESKPPVHDNEEHIFLNIEEHISHVGPEESEMVEPEESEVIEDEIEDSDQEEQEIAVEERTDTDKLEESDDASGDSGDSGEDEELQVDNPEKIDDDSGPKVTDEESDDSGDSGDSGEEVDLQVESDSDKLVTHEVVEEEQEEEDDDEEGVFEIDINNVTYYTNDEANGDIYEITEDGEPGNQVGRFIDGSPTFDKK
jgi:hypothetical protein